MLICTKRHFNSKAHAKKTAKRLKRANRSHHPIDVYLCSFCDTWHVGQRRPGNLRVRGGPPHHVIEVGGPSHAAG